MELFIRLHKVKYKQWDKHTIGIVTGLWLFVKGKGWFD